MVQDFLDRFAGLKDVVEVGYGQGGHLGAGDEVGFHFGGDAKGAFGTDHHTGEVEAVGGGGAGVGADGIGQKFVQVIAADPAHNVGVTGADLGIVVLRQAADAAVDFRLQPGAAELGLQLGAVQRAETGRRRIGEDYIQLHNVVQGFAVDHGMGAAGVVAHAAADTGAAGGGGVGGVHQAVGQQFAVELV